jgi:hypothetical protein
MLHVRCLRIPDVVWLHVISNALTAFGYGKTGARISLWQHDRSVLLAVRNYRSPTYLDDLAR